MNQMNSADEKPSVPNGSGEALDLGRLAHSLGFLLRMAQIETFDAFHAELGEHGLKPGEFSVFWLISRYPGIRQGRVANSLRIKKAHMTKLVRGLEERGYVIRTIPDNDRRSVLLELTEKGQEFVSRHQDDFFAYVFSNDGALSADEVQLLISLLQKFTGIQDGGAA